MAIEFGVRSKIAQFRGEAVYMEQRMAIEWKAGIASGATPVATFIELHDRILGTLNYMNSLPRDADTRTAFIGEFPAVPPGNVSPFFDDLILKLEAMMGWILANQQASKEGYILNGTDMSSRPDYTIAEMSSLSPLLDDLLTALTPIRVP